jgi:hypothetical protein
VNESANENEEVAMEAAMDRELAAETLRSVEGMRRRTVRESMKSSPFPLFMFGLAALIAAPFGFLGWEPAISIVLGVTLAAAVVVSELHYRRLAVHPAPLRRRHMGVVEAIIFAAVIIVFAPMAFGVIFSLGALANGGVSMFLAVTAFAIFLGRRLRNGALALTGGFSLFAVAIAPFTWNNHWEGIAALLYAAAFLGVGAAVRSMRSAA